MYVLHISIKEHLIFCLCYNLKKNVCVGRGFSVLYKLKMITNDE